MLPSFSIQKLERYAQFALRKDNMDKFVQASLKDETNQNIYSLTHVPSWVETSESIAKRKTQVTANLIHAMGCGVALLHGSLSSSTPKEYLCGAVKAAAVAAKDNKKNKGKQAAKPAPVQSSEAATEDPAIQMTVSDKTVTLVAAWKVAMQTLARDQYGDSVAVTEATAALALAAARFISSAKATLATLTGDEDEEEDTHDKKRNRGENGAKKVTGGADDTCGLFNLSAAHLSQDTLVTVLSDATALLIFTLRRLRTMWTRFAVPKLVGLSSAKSKSPLLFALSEVASFSEELHATVSSFLAPIVATEASKFYVFYRGDSDRVQIRLQNSSSAANLDQNAGAGAAHHGGLVGYVTNAHEQLTLIGSTSGPQQSASPKAASSTTPTVNSRNFNTWVSWLRMHSVIFVAFCKEGSWVELANEQRRLMIAKDLDRSKGRQTKREKELAKRERDAARRGTSTTGSIAPSNRSGRSSADDDNVSDAGSARSAHSAHSARNTRTTGGGYLDEDLQSIKSHNSQFSAGAVGSAYWRGSTKVGVNRYDDDDAHSFVSEVMSHFSAASAYSSMSVASVATAMTMMPLVEDEEKERQAHDSEDGNTNLPIILLEMLCQSIHDFLDRVRKEIGNSHPDMCHELHVLGWQEVGRMFSAVRQLMQNVLSSESSTVKTSEEEQQQNADGGAQIGIFNLPDDLRFNKARGYQTLGSILARMLLPALASENAAAAGTEEEVKTAVAIMNTKQQDDSDDDNIAADAEEAAERQMGVANERLAEFLPRSFFSSVLSRCLRVYEAVAAQIINAHIKPILLAVTSGVVRYEPEQQKTSAQTESSVAMDFLCHLCDRFGRTNQVSILLEAMTDLAWPGLLGANKNAAQQQLVAATEEGDDAAAANAAAAILSSSGDVVKDLEQVAAILSYPTFRTAMHEAVQNSMDADRLTTFVNTLITKGVIEADSSSDLSSSEKVLQLRRIATITTIASIVEGGIMPTPLVALTLIEHATELDLTVAMALGNLHKNYFTKMAALNRGEEPADEEDDEEEPPLLGTLKINKKTTSAALYDVGAALLEMVCASRRLVASCFGDLGLDDTEAFFAALEDSLWSVTSSIGSICGLLTPSEISDFFPPADDQSSVPLLPHQLVLQRLHLGFNVQQLLQTNVVSEENAAAAKDMVKFVLEYHDVSEEGNVLVAAVPPLSRRDFEILSHFGSKLVSKFLKKVEAIAMNTAPTTSTISWVSGENSLRCQQRAWLVLLSGAGELLPSANEVVAKIHATARQRGGLCFPIETVAALFPVFLNSAGAADEQGATSNAAELATKTLECMHDVVAIAFPSPNSVSDDDAVKAQAATLGSIEETLIPMLNAASTLNEKRAGTAAAQLIPRLFSFAAALGDDATTAIAEGMDFVLKHISSTLKQANKNGKNMETATILEVEANINLLTELLKPKNTKKLLGLGDTKKSSTTTHHNQLVRVGQRLAESAVVLPATSRRVAIAAISSLLATLPNLESMVNLVKVVLSSLGDDVDGAIRSVMLDDSDKVVAEGWVLVWQMLRIAASTTDEDVDYMAILTAENTILKEMHGAHRTFVPQPRSVNLLFAKMPEGGDEKQQKQFVSHLKQRVHYLITAALNSTGDDVSVFQTACKFLLSATGVHSSAAKASDFKPLVETALSAASASNCVTMMAAAVPLTHNPLPTYHAEAEFLDLELSFVAQAFDLLAHPIKAGGHSNADTTQHHRGCFMDCVQTLSMLAAKFSSQLQKRLHILVPILAPLTKALLIGLESGLYDGVVANAVSALMYHLTRKDLLKGNSVFHNAAFQASCYAASHFTAGATSLDTFTRYSVELDACARDISSLLLRGKPLAETVPAKAEVANHYSELGYICIPTATGKSLLKKAVLRAKEEGDAMTAFGAQGHVSFAGAAM